MSRLLNRLTNSLFRSRIGHAVVALAVFLGVSGVFLAATGYFTDGGRAGASRACDGHDHAEHADSHGAKPKAPDACCPSEDGAHQQAPAGGPAASAPAHVDEHSDHDDHDGHAHGRPVSGNVAPEAIEKKSCEHGVRTMDCDECRFEVGVVKVKAPVAEALLKTATVRRSELVGMLRLTGEVRFDQTTVADLTPAAAGKVLSVKVQLGQKVAEGDVLAVLHSGELGETKAAYLEALTTAEIAAKERDRQAAVASTLQKLLAQLKDGSSAPDLNGEPLGEWKSKLVGAAARLQQAQAVHEREKALVEKQASSKAELEAAQRELKTAGADYAALVEEIQLNLQLERLRAENAARQAQARAHAAEQRLHLLGVDDKALAELGAANENGRFALLEIRAPRAGTVTAVQVTAGRYVDATQSLFTVCDLSNLWVWCDLYERDMEALHALLERGESPPATVKVGAFRESFSGRIDLIDSHVNESTRTVKVRVQLANHDGRLKPGMFATVDVELPAGRKALLAPKAAILSDEGRHFAFQHWRDDLWLRRHVALGQASGEMIEIVSGLDAGATVVTGGAFVLKSDVLRAKMGAGCAD